MKRKNTPPFAAGLYMTVSFLAVLKLGLIGLAFFAPDLYSDLLIVVSELPEPVKRIPELLRMNPYAWTIWNFMWRHIVLLWLAVVLVLPLLIKNLLSLCTFMSDLLIEVRRRWTGLVNGVIDFVLRLRSQPVTLEGSQYVLITFSSGDEQLINIKSCRRWEAENGLILVSDDNGEVALVTSQGPWLLRDRETCYTDQSPFAGQPEFQCVYSVTLYKDLCPYCEENVFLPPYAGYFRTILAVELGRPATGKTLFANALKDPI